jgi:hypothetical protein
MVNEEDKLPNVVTDGELANREVAPLLTEDNDVNDGGESLEICVPLDGEETPLPNEG